MVSDRLDREEKEAYHLTVTCHVQTAEKLHKLDTSLHIGIHDEDDSPPYVDGIDTEDVHIEFSRSAVSEHIQYETYNCVAA